MYRISLSLEYVYYIYIYIYMPSACSAAWAVLAVFLCILSTQLVMHVAELSLVALVQPYLEYYLSMYSYDISL